MSDIENPWREFIENCISGDNYFRASEYADLLADLDRGYMAEARLADATRFLTEVVRDYHITRTDIDAFLRPADSAPAARVCPHYDMVIVNEPGCPDCAADSAPACLICKKAPVHDGYSYCVTCIASVEAAADCGCTGDTCLLRTDCRAIAAPADHEVQGAVDREALTPKPDHGARGR